MSWSTPGWTAFFFLTLSCGDRSANRSISLSKPTPAPCRGGPRARCCWDYFAETPAAISEKSQQTNQQSLSRRSRARWLRDCLRRLLLRLAERSQQKHSKQYRDGPRVWCGLGFILLSLLRRFRASLSTQISEQCRGGTAPGVVGVLLLRLLLRCRRSLSKNTARSAATVPRDRRRWDFCG